MAMLACGPAEQFGGSAQVVVVSQAIAAQRGDGAGQPHRQGLRGADAVPGAVERFAHTEGGEVVEDGLHHAGVGLTQGAERVAK